MNSDPLPSTKRIHSPAYSTPPQSLPRPVYFDSRTNAWVISRFADVQGAFLETNLCPVGENTKSKVTAKDRDDQARIRAEAIEALTPAKLAQWESDFASQALSIASALPTSRAIDVVEEFARPWAFTVAVQVTGANIQDAQRFAHLAAQVSASTANPDDPSLKAPAQAAGAELNDALKHGAVPMAGPAFVGLSQTLPCLLANVWHALLQHTRELERLHDAPGLVSRTLEELLRYAGLVNVLHRQAIEDVELGGISVKAGERLRLMVEAAHRDREQFSLPDEMDISRRAARHFAFGAGPHSCAAAPLLRMALAVATRSFVTHFTAIESPEPVNWHGGAVFRWPAPLYANRRKN
jgi:cytochrome P450